MPGRKNPKEREEDRDREYRLTQKRGYGEHVVGDEAEDLADSGPAAQVEREREKWAENKERKSRQDF